MRESLVTERDNHFGYGLCDTECENPWPTNGRSWLTKMRTLGYWVREVLVTECEKQDMRQFLVTECEDPWSLNEISPCHWIWGASNTECENPWSPSARIHSYRMWDPLVLYQQNTLLSSMIHRMCEALALTE